MGQAAFSTFAVGGLLLASAALIIGLLLILLYGAVRGACGGTVERFAFRRCVVRCRRGDELVERGDRVGAIRAYGAAFFLRPIRRSSSLLPTVGNYHTGLLSRLLTVADEMHAPRARLPSLIDADRLLTERAETQLEYFRGVERGDRAMAWDAERHLRENGRQLRVSIVRLIGEIGASDAHFRSH